MGNCIILTYLLIIVIIILSGICVSLSLDLKGERRFRKVLQDRIRRLYLDYSLVKKVSEEKENDE